MFRVGDVVEREVLDGFVLGVKNFTVSHINEAKTHVKFADDGMLYHVGNYKLIKPVWKVGDEAKVILHGSSFGEQFNVVRVEPNFVFEKYDNFQKISYSLPNVERIAMVEEKAGIEHRVREDGVHEIQINAGAFHLTVPEDGGPPITLESIIAREMKIPTYLYDVVEVKPRLISGGVCLDDTWRISMEAGSSGRVVTLDNVDYTTMDAERLRKLAKLCADLADLMV